MLAAAEYRYSPLRAVRLKAAEHHVHHRRAQLLPGPHQARTDAALSRRAQLGDLAVGERAVARACQCTHAQGGYWTSSPLASILYVSLHCSHNSGERQQASLAMAKATLFACRRHHVTCSGAASDRGTTTPLPTASE